MEPFVHTRRILLVEDLPEVSTTLKRRLEEAEYHVTLAKNYQDAKNFLDTEHFHLALFDLRLDDQDEQNQDGMRLLEYAHKSDLISVMPCIILTAYETTGIILRAREELGAIRFIVKEPEYITNLIDSIKTIFQETIKINFELEVDEGSRERIDTCTAYIHQNEEKQLPVSEIVRQQMFDLVGALFIDARRLSVDHLIQGFSGAAVLYITPNWRNGVGNPLVVKLGRVDKIDREFKNYEEYVRRYLPANHATTLDVRYTRHLGAISYSMPNADIRQTRNFETFYHGRSAQDILKSLRHLFRHTCEIWYNRSRTAPQLLNLRDRYYRAFDLTPERLPFEINMLRPEVNSQTPEIRFETLDLSLPNPLLWLDREGKGAMSISTCITHGDLNARNILINERGECWLIDFYRTYRSHILRDFVELETDIKFRLLPILSMERFLAFERQLVEMTEPSGKFNLRGEVSPDEKKAAQVIAGLRAEAWSLFDRYNKQSARDIQREYLSSLLMATMNIIRLRHFKDKQLEPQRERALLSAGLIYQEIKRLSTLGLQD